MADDSIPGGDLLKICDTGAYNLIEGIISMAMSDTRGLLSGRKFKRHEYVDEYELKRFWDSEWCGWLMFDWHIGWETAKAAAIRQNDYLALRGRNGCTSNKRCPVALCPHRCGKAIDLTEYEDGKMQMYCIRRGCMID